MACRSACILRGATVRRRPCWRLPPSWKRRNTSPLVSVHAVHGGRRKSRGVARRHRSRDVRPGGWNLDVPPQAVGAADERPVRDWLGQDAFRVTGVSADRLSNGTASTVGAPPSRGPQSARPRVSRSFPPRGACTGSSWSPTATILRTASPNGSAESSIAALPRRTRTQRRRSAKRSVRHSPGVRSTIVTRCIPALNTATHSPTATYTTRGLPTGTGS